MNKMFAAAAMVASVVAVGVASVTFDPVTGAGFVGKGDVQLVYGWNNAQLQDNAGTVEFRYMSSTETVTSWTCTKPAQGNQFEPIEQERSSKVTISSQGVIDSEARDRRQITGFILHGFAGDPVIISETDDDGPKPNTCPNANSGYVLDADSVQVQINQLGGGLEVGYAGGNWQSIP